MDKYAATATGQIRDVNRVTTDKLSIERVANGWIVRPGPNCDAAFIHIAASPEDLAKHVLTWAQAVVAAKESVTHAAGIV